MGKVSTNKKSGKAAEAVVVAAAAAQVVERNGTNGASHDSPTHDDIAQRAYAIYEREGRPHGRDLEHWLAAEAELGA